MKKNCDCENDFIYKYRTTLIKRIIIYGIGDACKSTGHSCWRTPFLVLYEVPLHLAILCTIKYVYNEANCNRLYPGSTPHFSFMLVMHLSRILVSCL